ncbi:MAG: LytR C-terminal domain-containing protein, partial [Solirubrobacteraceae bacterium]
SGSSTATTPATTPAAPAQDAGATAAVPPAATAAAAARQAGAPSRGPSALGNGAGGQETHESAAARPDPPAPPPPPSPPLSSASAVDDRGGFSATRYALIIGGAVATVLAAAVLMYTLTRDDPAPKPNDFGSVTQPSATPAEPGATSTLARPGTPASVNRRATRVAVLNGTTQTGLARAVADKVEQARFTIAGTENNADQAVPTTTVSYRSGNERAAQIVAQAIGVDRSSVQPVDANTSAAADADVVVIVGADKIG